MILLNYLNIGQQDSDGRKAITLLDLLHHMAKRKLLATSMIGLYKTCISALIVIAQIAMAMVTMLMIQC